MQTLFLTPWIARLEVGTYDLKLHMSRSVDDLRPGAVDIPGASHAQELTNQLNTIVGSPEQISNLQLRSRSFRGPPLGMDDLLSRPSILRNVSSATLPPTRGSGTSSRIHDINSMSGFRPHGNNSQSREWSVFGELYDAEDRARASASHSGVRSRHNALRQNLNTSKAYPPSRDTDPQGATIQSPVEDPRLAGTLAESSEEEDESLLHNGGSVRSGPFTSFNDAPPPSRSPWRYCAQLLSKFPTLSPLHRNILKCSVAYFIASLFTFSPYLSGFIADLTNYGRGESYPAPSGHMVATVCVIMAFSTHICGSLPPTAPCISTPRRHLGECSKRTNTASWDSCSLRLCL